MQTHVRCGTVFTGGSTSEALADHTICFDERGEITHVGPTSEAPPAASDDAVLDYSRLFVMPGLQDVHTHLAYGNAKSEEDIDLYQPMEFRALRGLFFAQKVLAAGYTADLRTRRCRADQPLGAQRDQLRPVRRPARDRGWALPHLAPGPDGLVPDLDRRPRHLDRPARHQRDEAIEEIRVQVKNGVDCIKIAMDGTQTRENGELIAAFNQEETSAMVTEAHRLGRRVVVHARGREAMLYSARAGVDLIFHAYYLDDECIDAMVKSGSAIGPDHDLPAQHHRLHPAARARRDQGAPRRCRARIRPSPARTCGRRSGPACR